MLSATQQQQTTTTTTTPQPTGTLGIKDSPVTAVCGVPVRNLAHLARLASEACCTEEYMRFDLEAANKVRWGGVGEVGE